MTDAYDISFVSTEPPISNWLYIRFFCVFFHITDVYDISMFVTFRKNI